MNELPMNQRMRHLDLFSGIGGFAYAAQQVWGEEHEIVAFCEIDKFCQKVLKKHWPDIEIVNDVKDERIKQFRDIDLLTGGVPCQPASVAGAQRGTSDERWLWPETLAIIGLVRPCYAILENVSGLFGLEEGLAFNGILSGLAEIGYDCWWETIPACAVGAPHRRDRIWIVAYDNSIRCDRRESQGQGIQWTEQTCDENITGDNHACDPIGVGRRLPKGRDVDGKILHQKQRKEIANPISRPDRDAADTRSEKPERLSSKCRQEMASIRRDCENVADPDNAATARQRRNGGKVSGIAKPERFDVCSWKESWPEVATRLCRVGNGVPDRVDRLKSLGNAIVPQVAIMIMEAIKRQANR